MDEFFRNSFTLFDGSQNHQKQEIKTFEKSKNEQKLLSANLAEMTQNEKIFQHSHEFCRNEKQTENINEKVVHPGQLTSTTPMTSPIDQKNSIVSNDQFYYDVSRIETIDSKNIPEDTRKVQEEREENK